MNHSPHTTRAIQTARLVAVAALILSSVSNAATPARLIVLNKAEATAAIVDPVTLKVLGRVPTGDGPHEAVVSTDGKIAIIANYGAQTPGNSLTLIDIDNIKEIRRHDLGPFIRPHGLQIVGGKLYFTSELTRSVARYDIASDKVDWLMGTGASLTHMVVATADGKRLYTSNLGSNTVTSLRLDGPANKDGITQIAVGGQPEAIDLSPDGLELWVGHNADGGISIIDTTNNTVKDTIKAGVQLNRVKFSPNGKYVLASDPRGATSGEVIVIDPATRKVVQRIEMPGRPLGIQFAPDGKRAFVARSQAKRVDVIDMEKLTIVDSVETGEAPDGLAWRAASEQ